MSIHTHCRYKHPPRHRYAHHCHEHTRRTATSTDRKHTAKCLMNQPLITSDTADPLVSVIIPIYNIEHYVARCIQSIIDQTYQTLQIILVNDGATDTSPQICQHFADVDARIDYVSRINGGLSAARNTGLEVTKGEYVLFVDGDDYIAPDHIDELIRATQSTNADIACSGHRAVMPDTTHVHQPLKGPHCTETLTQHQALTRLFYQDGLTTSAWAKLYRRQILEGIRYPEGQIFEDLPTTYRVFARAQRITLIHSDTYFYVQRPGSIVSLRNTRARIKALDFANEAVKYAADISPRLETAARNRLFMEAVYTVAEAASLKLLRSEAHPACVTLRAERSRVLRDARARPPQKMYAIAAHFGYISVRLLARAHIHIKSFTLRLPGRNPR